MLHRAICEGKRASGLTSAARRSETLPESAPTVAAALQRGIGNQAVGRLIGPRVDAKERDADRIASNVMHSRLPPALSRMAGDAQVRNRFESAYGQDFGRV